MISKVISDNQIISEGLIEKIGLEIAVDIGIHEKNMYEFCIDYIVEYVLTTGNLIEDGQTMSYFSWLIKFIKEDSRILRIHELNHELNDFSIGVEYSISIQSSQMLVCKKNNSNYQYPRYNQLVAVSDGFFDGMAVDGVRYESPDHMSGWYLTTSIFDDDINKLKLFHFTHIAKFRPELVKFLGLEPGFRFYSEDSAIWFDSEVLED